MAIALSILGVAFAAFCIWLAVRVLNRRERWATRTAVAVVACLPFLYVLSVGPVRRMAALGYLTQSEKTTIARFYSPLELTPSPIFDAIVCYARLWD